MRSESPSSRHTPGAIALRRPIAALVLVLSATIAAHGTALASGPPGGTAIGTGETGETRMAPAGARPVGARTAQASGAQAAPGGGGAASSAPDAPAAADTPAPAAAGRDPVDRTLAPSPAEAAAKALLEGTAAAPDADAAGAPTRAWQVDHADSRVTFAFEIRGERVTGEIGTWRADIAFDPNDLANASIAVILGMESVTVASSPLTAAQITGGDWLATDTFGDAEFIATAIEAAGQGRYEADGTLTIKGITRPLTVPFTLEVADGIGRAESSFTFDRLDYGIGPNGDRQGGATGREVTISVELKAAAPAALTAR